MRIWGADAPVGLAQEGGLPLWRPAALPAVTGSAHGRIAPVVPMRSAGTGVACDGDWAGAEVPGVVFADVAGLTDVKERLRAAVADLLETPVPGHGAPMPEGLLLHGPAGCGKTLLVRALAGELGVRFLSMGLRQAASGGGDLAAAGLRRCFESARTQAPCVLVLDDVEAFPRVDCLIQEVEQTRGTGVVVVGITEHLEDVHTALRAPGRLTDAVFVGRPDAPARQAILRTLLRPHNATIDIGCLVERTDGWSAADLQRLVQTAAQEVWHSARCTGRLVPMDLRDLQWALRCLYGELHARRAL